uniref:Ig-like domain-containing protein n=1 Tax=Sinocyclocheilus anshuiensis TaxID=1608454 RepID=A0A671SYH1_9TELE
MDEAESSPGSSHVFYWTLWMLSCFGQYLGEDLQFSEPANGAVGGSVVFAPDNLPSTSIDTVQWGFGTTIILTAQDRYLLNVKDSFSDSVSLFCLSLSLTHTHTHTERISNGRPTGPEESLIEGESSANISSEGTGSISSVQWMKDHSNSIIFSSDNRCVHQSSAEIRQWRISFVSESFVCALDGPEDVSIKAEDVVDLGVRVSLSCSANSEPAASFNWKINGTDTDVTTDTFIIDETDFTHSGDYICTAWNSVTKRSASQKHALLVKEGGGGLTSGAIAGIVIGVLVAVAGICGLTVYLTKTKKISSSGIVDVYLLSYVCFPGSLDFIKISLLMYSTSPHSSLRTPTQ